MRSFNKLSILLLIVFTIPFANFANVFAQGEATAIEIDETAEGTLTADQRETHYILHGQAGDSILITLESDDFDTYLSLEFDNEEIFYNDDGGEGLNSQIGPYILQSNGEYTIIATSYNGVSIGDYTLSIMTVDVTHIEQGEAVELSFTESDQTLYFSFSAEENTIVDIITESDFDIDMLFRGNMDGFTNYANTNSIDALSIPATGSFILELTPTQSTESQIGDFTLRITPTEIPSLNEGSQVFTFGTVAYRAFFSLDVEAGETYHVTLTVLDGETASLNLYITQDGIDLEPQIAPRVTNMTADFTPENSGTLIFTLYDYGLTTHAVEVSAEQIEAE